MFVYKKGWTHQIQTSAMILSIMTLSIRIKHCNTQLKGSNTANQHQTSNATILNVVMPTAVYAWYRWCWVSVFFVMLSSSMLSVVDAECRYADCYYYCTYFYNTSLKSTLPSQSSRSILIWQNTRIHPNWPIKYSASLSQPGEAFGINRKIEIIYLSFNLKQHWHQTFQTFHF